MKLLDNRATESKVKTEQTFADAKRVGPNEV